MLLPVCFIMDGWMATSAFELAFSVPYLYNKREGKFFLNAHFLINMTGRLWSC